MGHGIGQVFAHRGFRVTLYDVKEEILRNALGQIESHLQTFCHYGFINRREIRTTLSRIDLSLNLEKATRNAHFVLEATPEDLQLKKNLCRDLDTFCSPSVIIASNTSGLSLTEMVSLAIHQERFVIAHWFNPPYIVPTVEVVKGERTSNETFETTYQLLKKAGKLPIRILKEIPGFLLNRIQFAMFREVLFCLEQGLATAEDIDLAVKGSLGFRLPTIGPLMTSDLGGLDTFYRISQYLFKVLDDSKIPHRVLKEKIEQGKLGAKTGEGFFKYSPRKMKKLIEERDHQFLQRLKCLYRK